MVLQPIRKETGKQSSASPRRMNHMQIGLNSAIAIVFISGNYLLFYL